MIFNWLLLLVPVPLVLTYVVHAAPVWIFVSAVLAIVPLAEWIRRATEQLAKLSGPAIGGLLNVTFGNTAELVLALAILIGSWGREAQTFKRERSGQLSSLLLLALIGLLVPALFNYTERTVLGAPNAGLLDEQLSLSVAVVLILAYIGNLVYTLVTHRDVFARQDRMGLVLSITVGSSIQVALLVAPVLVIVSYFMGDPLNLVFTPLELIAVAGVAFSVNAIAADGETTWFEGLLLVAVYAVLGLAFFFVTP